MASFSGAQLPRRFSFSLAAAAIFDRASPAAPISAVRTVGPRERGRLVLQLESGFGARFSSFAFFVFVFVSGRFLASPEGRGASRERERDSNDSSAVGVALFLVFSFSSFFLVAGRASGNEKKRSHAAEVC